MIRDKNGTILNELAIGNTHSVKDLIMCCDFCEAETKYPMGDEQSKMMCNWTFGHRGSIESFQPTCQVQAPQVKHACPDSLCQAKLLIWTRS